MVSWTTINTFGLPIAIYFLRNGVSYYRSLRRTTHLRQGAATPTPPEVGRALNVLFLSAIVALVLTLPYFAPENIFALTKGRLQTSTDVLFNRLAQLRPHQTLTTFDELLRAKLGSKDNRLHYFAFGPDAVANCVFCTPAASWTYLVYNLPTLLGPHVLHLAVLGLVTSPPFAGPQAARWRNFASIAGISLAVADLWLAGAYNINANRGSQTLSQIDFFFWRMRTARALSIAAVDAVLGFVMWLAVTNRAFIAPPEAAQRISGVASALEVVNFRIFATGSVRNAVVRDKELREEAARYWTTEEGVYEEREVVDGIQQALTRINMAQLSALAAERAQQVVTEHPLVPSS